MGEDSFSYLPRFLSSGQIAVGKSILFYKGLNNTIQSYDPSEIINLKSSVSEGKSLIASAITDKGISTASNATFQTMADNILLITGKPSVPDLFGDGSDGIGLFSSNTTWSVAVEDTGMIIKQFETLTISQNVIVSAGNRNCGMIIKVQGDCNIAGTLSNILSCKTLRSEDNVDFSIYPYSMLSSVAGNGGDGGSTKLYNTESGTGMDYYARGGKGMSGRFYGGGWSGGGAGGCYPAVSGEKDKLSGGAGGDADGITTAISNIFIGGAAIRTSSSTNRFTKGNPGYYGGGGGGASGMSGSSGAGGSSPGAIGGSESGYQSSQYSSPGGGAGNIGGGVIILLVGGKLTITGTIDCSGGKGGDAGYDECSNRQHKATSGGGAGGGRIFICYKGEILNNGTLNVSGGQPGAYPAPNQTAVDYRTCGTAGTDGTLNIKTYDQYIAEDIHP